MSAREHSASRLQEIAAVLFFVIMVSASSLAAVTSASAQDVGPLPANPPVVNDPAPAVVPPAAEAPAGAQPDAADDGGVNADNPPANAGSPAAEGKPPAAMAPVGADRAAPSGAADSGVAAPDGSRVTTEPPAGSTVPPASGELPAAAGTEAAPPADSNVDAVPPGPAPSLLEDPAGAVAHMLAPAERDLTLPHNLSPWGMFLGADWVVKVVMIGLAFASLVTWTVWIAKSLELMGARTRVRRALKAIGTADTLEQASRALARRSDPASLLVHAAEHEVRRSADALERGGGQGLLQRVTSHLSRIEIQAGSRMTRGTGVLATIGSTAPFVGLFGTVWGIMRSFIGISEAQTTNLAVVAPGIAEALLATALGLVAAIPAVVIFNQFARAITGYRQLLGDMSAAIERQVSRDLDRGLIPRPLAGMTALTQAAQ